MENKQEKDVVLVVDDQPNNLKVIASTLGEEYSLAIANNGRNALKMLEKGNPDLILLDIMMPEMDGFEVCQRIKENPAAKEIPIIFLTAKTDIDDITKGFNLGAVDYIFKPFNPSEVRVRVKNHINLYHSKNEIKRMNTALHNSKEELKSANELLNKQKLALENHSILLEQLVAARTSELELAKKKAEYANRAKTIFLANMSHELRTPLIGILGYSEMLIDDLEEEEKEMAAGINRTGKRLLHALSLILTLTKLEAERYETNISLLDCIPLLHESFISFENTALSKSLKYQLNIHRESLFIRIDPAMFKEIFDNLIGNAIKFTNNGKVEITTCETKISDIDYLQITVKDTGIGIEEEDLTYIFDEFKQLSEGFTKEYQGTGLGLTITKKFVELLGGKIEVSSTKGIGTTFTVKFPK